MLRYRKNQILLPFNFWPAPVPREGKNIYEMRSYTLKVGKAIYTCTLYLFFFERSIHKILHFLEILNCWIIDNTCKEITWFKYFTIDIECG